VSGTSLSLTATRQSVPNQNKPQNKPDTHSNTFYYELSKLSIFNES